MKVVGSARRASVSNGNAPRRNSRRAYASRVKALFSVPLPSHHAGPCERRRRCTGAQRPVGGDREGRGHGGQAVARADVRVRAVRVRKAESDSEPAEVDVAAGRAVRARLVAEHAQVGREQDGGLRREHRRALRLRADDPVAARLARARIARVLDQDDDRVRVVVDRPVHGARRFEDVGEDHVHAGSEALRLAARELGAERADHRVADRLGEERLAAQRAGRHHRRVEVVAGGLQVRGALGRIRRHLAARLVHDAVADEVEHGDRAHHRVRQRFGIGCVERERAHRRQRGKIGRFVLAGESLERIGAEVDRPVAVGEEAHRPMLAPAFRWTCRARSSATDTALTR